MPANVTELPRSGRHVQAAPGEDPLVAAAAAVRFTRRLIIGGTAASTVWLSLAAWYVHAYLGWGLLAAILPYELAAFVAGVTMPLAFLWLVLVFMKPNRELRQHTDALRRQLALLTFPAEEA